MIPQKYLDQLPSYITKYKTPYTHPWLFCIYSKKDQTIINSLKSQNKIKFMKVPDHRAFFQDQHWDETRLKRNTPSFSDYMQAYQQGDVSADQIKQKFKKP
jgi:hypothetical protein